MRKVMLAVATAGLLLAGCVSTNSTMLGGQVAGPALDPNSVAMFRTAAQVPGEYREIALLNSAGDANWTNQNAMYQSMKEEAARLGANGIILDATTEPGAGARVAAAIFGVGVNREGRAIAIDVAGLPHNPAPPPRRPNRTAR